METSTVVMVGNNDGRPDTVDTLVLSGRFDQMSSQQRITGWVRGAPYNLSDAEMRQACVAQRRALRSTGGFTGNICRVCGEVIPPTGKKGKPALVHADCREADKQRKADDRSAMRSTASGLVNEVTGRLFG